MLLQFGFERHTTVTSTPAYARTMLAQDSDQTFSGPGFRWDPHPVLTQAVNEWRQAEHTQELYYRFWLQAMKDQVIHQHTNEVARDPLTNK